MRGELQRRQYDPDRETEQRSIKALPDTRQDLAELISHLCGESPVTAFLAQLSDEEFNSKFALLARATAVVRNII